MDFLHFLSADCLLGFFCWAIDCFTKKFLYLCNNITNIVDVEPVFKCNKSSTSL